MPMVLGEAQLGPENEELTGARHLMLTRDARIHDTERTERGLLVTGMVAS
jgi:hypothetical protein